MKKADLLGEPVEIADEIGEDAVEAAGAHIELLMLVGGDEEFARGNGQGETSF
jgi:hypothetical protein